jgi:hypothetical protein
MTDDRNLIAPADQTDDMRECFRCKCGHVGFACWDIIEGYFCVECDEGLYPGAQNWLHVPPGYLMVDVGDDDG